MAQASFGSLLLCAEIRIKMSTRKYLNSMLFIIPMYKLDNFIDQMKDLSCELFQPCKLSQHSVLRSPKVSFLDFFFSSEVR